jgi:RNA polymerase sigma factor (sigma-70 family)
MSVRLPQFQALLDAHGRDVYRFCAAMVGPVEADDCYQETWIAALRAYPGLRSARNLRSWVLRIAHNKAMDVHRARSRRPIPVASVPDGAASRPVGNSRDSEVLGRLKELPPKQRTAVFCRSVLGMPYAELAVVLESSEDAARRNVHEGLKRLREEYAR